MKSTQQSPTTQQPNELTVTLRNSTVLIDGALWKLVPIRPTQQMCQEGQWKAREWPTFPLRISPIYQAMLAAAPEAPKPIAQTNFQGGQDEFDAWRQS